MHHKKILLIDDDPDLLEILKVKLSKEGFVVRFAMDATSGFKKIIDQNPDLILLDIDMPGKNGLELCKSIRSSPENSELPIIILSARDEQIDRLLGLELGADDYITKPFDTRELILRIKSVLKRVYSSKRTKDNFQFGCLMVDFNSHSVKVHDEPVNLTLTEFKLLSYLVAEPGKTQSREFFLDKVWDYGDEIYSRTIDTHIQRLRTKLDEAGGYIQTVRGVGYRFNVE
jgi:two-component system phosphate regulon response regulator PhoB